jgi:hypothetical protein
MRRLEIEVFERSAAQFLWVGIVRNGLLQTFIFV